MSILKRFTRPVLNPILSLGLCASLAIGTVTATATPAKADNEAAFAAAVIGLMIAAGAIGTGNASANSGSSHNNNQNWNNGRGNGNGNGYGNGNRRNSRALPGECVVEVAYGRDRGAYFDKNCLQRSYDRTNSLPRWCQENITYRNGGARRVYDASCLYRQGYVIEARNGRGNNGHWNGGHH